MLGRANFPAWVAPCAPCIANCHFVGGSLIPDYRTRRRRIVGSRHHKGPNLERQSTRLRRVTQRLDSVRRRVFFLVDFPRKYHKELNRKTFCNASRKSRRGRSLTLDPRLSSVIHSTKLICAILMHNCMLCAPAPSPSLPGRRLKMRLSRLAGVASTSKS
jgi:hypothetical protein